MKQFKNLRIFGSSTSVAGQCVKPTDSFWGLTSKALQIDTVVNYSWGGCGFDSICHILVSEQTHFDWNLDFFLIVIPPLERWTVFDNHKDTKRMADVIKTADWKAEKFEITSHHGLENISFYGDKQTVVFEDRSWTEVVAMRHIFFLTKWLDSLHADYLIVNGSKPFMEDSVWLPGEFLLSYCISHPRVNVFCDTYMSVNVNVNYPADYDTLGWNGHHAAPGNQRFFELGILPHLKALNLC